MSSILVVRDRVDANGQKYTEQGHFIDAADLGYWVALGYRVDLGASIPKNQDRPAMQSDLAVLIRTVNSVGPDASGNVVVAGGGGGAVTSVNITDSSAVGRAVLTAADATAARALLGAGVSNLALGATSSTAKPGDYVPASTDLTDATAIGKALIVAASAPAARTAIGAGTSNLALGTTGSTAAAGNDARLSDARTPLAHTHVVADVTGLTGQLAAKADLVGGVIPTSQLPVVSLGETFPAASQSAMLALAATPGDVALRSDTSPASAWMLLASPASTLANWFNLSASVSGAVTSINGQTGTVVLGKTDIALGNVDNTADSAKPVSTAQATAIALKPDKTTTISAGTGLTGGGDLSANRSLAVSYGTTAGTAAQGNDSRLSNARTPSSGTQFYDVALVAFGVGSSRAVGAGEGSMGVKLRRAATFSAVTFRVSTADASGNLVVELRKNGSTVSGTSTTIAAASQIAGGSTTGGTWTFAAGDILTAYVTAVGTTPGLGLVAEITGLA